MFKTTPYIIAIDIETSGLDKIKNRIIQLAGVKYSPRTWKKIEEFNHFIKPDGDWEMDPEAEKVHGISRQFIEEHGVSLKEIYQEWIDFIGDYDIITYNGNRFDIPFIYSDFTRVGLDPEILEHRIIDAYKIEKKVNTNTLESAYRRYTGKEPVGAHDAVADSDMTVQVFYEQQERYNISEILDPKDMTIDFPETIIELDDNNHIILAKGKYTGKQIDEVLQKDPGYIKWMFDSVLSERSKKKVLEHMDNSYIS